MFSWILHVFLNNIEEKYNFWIDCVYIYLYLCFLKGCSHLHFKQTLYECTYVSFILSTFYIIDI